MRWRIKRDTVLFVAGLAGAAHETILQNADRPYLLLLFGSMVGLPAFFKADERRQSNGRRK